MKSPVITLAMPVRNCEETVGIAIQSILEQSFQDWELLAIDDGSRDGTLEHLRRFSDKRIRVIHHDDCKGLAVRLNEAVSAASGDYLARMDGDDISYPIRLETQLDYLLRHPEVDLVGTEMLVFGREGRALGKRTAPRTHNEICRSPLLGIPLAHPTFFAKTAWFRKWGYVGQTGAVCDQDLLFRAFRESRYANLPEILLGYREEKLSFKKLLGYRTAHYRSLCTNVKPSTGRVRMFLALIGLAKSVADLVAISTGLKYRLLRHRAKPVTVAERTRWGEVWENLERGSKEKFRPAYRTAPIDHSKRDRPNHRICASP
jgi:hypothetical protein